jgi:hypothetical protein
MHTILPSKLGTPDRDAGRKHRRAIMRYATDAPR